MIDPVSEELASRERLILPWKKALGAALVLHLGVAALLLVGGGRHSRPLTLPRVQVRIGALPAPAGGPAAPAGSSAVSGAARTAPAAAPAAPAKAPKHVLPAPKATPRPSPGRAPTPLPAGPIAAAGPVVAHGEQATPSGASPGGSGTSQGPGGTSDHTGSGRGIGLGSGDGGGATDESFPYAYYLNRVLGAIEGNWFKPPATEGTRCRVRSRIDRSGRLLEAGIEEESGNPAFDRAALRAVFASAPFPPLPEGFLGGSLTLHLEFGP